MAAKGKRQNMIKEILRERLIASYGQLARALAVMGIRATQATLSRDFAELGVVRTVTPDGPRYLIGEDEAGRHIDRLLGFEILSVRASESLVVIHTLAGRAAGVARYVEQLNRKEIIGTIGGYCTVLVVPDSDRHVATVAGIIRSLMNKS
ncbi:MAG TPA: arginine repressor [Candidatus Edwardsbacteria bacterium]|nr:arginine repressor [Candidatus Edwardsbacteria bacterium]